MKRLLIVDDESGIRGLLVRGFSKLGHECVEASTAFGAMEHLRLASFDAAIIDIRMPGLSGIHLLSNVKDYDEDIAVIMITGCRDVEIAIQAMKMGADDYILKPLRLNDIEIWLNRALDNRRRQKRLREGLSFLEQSNRLHIRPSTGVAQNLQPVRSPIDRSTHRD